MLDTLTLRAALDDVPGRRIMTVDNRVGKVAATRPRSASRTKCKKRRTYEEWREFDRPGNGKIRRCAGIANHTVGQDLRLWGMEMRC